MRTSAPNYIATEQLIWLQHDGTQSRIVARIGLPYPVDDGTWACPAELQGVDARYPDVCGASSAIVRSNSECVPKDSASRVKCSVSK